MNILHISNGFAGSKVHGNLVRTLAKNGVCQAVYCPVRTATDISKNNIDLPSVNVVYSNIIKPWYKATYFHKAHVLYADMLHKIDVKENDIIHAATLFSDGLLAYKTHKQFGIPYVVAVRNTDYNDFIRLMPHLWPVGRKILMHAKYVFFISEGIKRQFEESAFARPIINIIRDRFVRIPNGVDDYWLDNVSEEPRLGHRILYIGDFSENKNVVRLINAVLKLRNTNDFSDTELVIIGGGKNVTNRVQKLISQHPECITYLGKIYDKQILTEVMHGSSLFAMPSIHETFGLVYIEALSQNLPVIYTKKQGIDGLFDESVGIAVNPFSVNDITGALKTMLSKREKYSNAHVDFLQFRWSQIAKRYASIYELVVNDSSEANSKR